MGSATKTKVNLMPLTSNHTWRREGNSHEGWVRKNIQISNMQCNTMFEVLTLSLLLVNF